jgi:hypothetical protein
VASYLRQRVQGSIAVCGGLLTEGDRGLGESRRRTAAARLLGACPWRVAPSPASDAGALAPRYGEILRPDRTIRMNVNNSIGYGRTVAPPDRPRDARLRPVLPRLFLCLAGPTRAGWQGRCGMRKLRRCARCAGAIRAAAQKRRSKWRASRRWRQPRRPDGRRPAPDTPIIWDD